MSEDLISLAAICVCAALISPLVILARALRHVWGYGQRYVATYCGVLGIPDASKAAPPPVPPQHYSKDGREPAYEYYLFGQARRDLAVALSRVITHLRQDLPADARRIVNARLIVTVTGYGRLPVSILWRRLIGIMFLAGLVAGCPGRRGPADRGHRRPGPDRGHLRLDGHPGHLRGPGRGQCAAPDQGHPDDMPELLPAYRLSVVPVFRLRRTASRHPAGTLRRTAPALRLRPQPAHAADPRQPPDDGVLPLRRLRSSAPRASGHRGRGDGGHLRRAERGENPAPDRHRDGPDGPCRRTCRHG